MQRTRTALYQQRLHVRSAAYSACCAISYPLILPLLTNLLQALGCATGAGFYARLTLYLLLPVISAAVPYALLAAYSALGSRCSRRCCGLIRHMSWQKARRTAFTSLLVLLFFFHLPVCTAILSVYRCAALQQGAFLVAEPTISCASEQHQMVQRAVAPIFLALYGVGIPALAAGVLYRNRDMLQSRRVLKYLGMMYDGLRRSAYLWEPAITLRKLLFLAIAVLVTDTMLQLLVGLMALTIVFGLHLYMRPFEERALNALEGLALFANLMLYFGLLVFMLARSKGDAALQVCAISSAR